jgi:hypothetical protein
MRKLIPLILFAAVSATASAESFSLTVKTIQGYGSGTVAAKLADGTIAITCTVQPPTTCTKTLPANSTVVLTATPATDHTFFGWRFGTGSAAACTGTAPCTFTLTANSEISAEFNPPSILTLRATGPGKITFPFGPNATILTCQSGHTLAEPFLPNSRVTLTAIPASGSAFVGWAVLGGSPSGPMCNLSFPRCSFIIDKRIFVEAKFSIAPPTPTVPPATPAPPVTVAVTKGGSGAGTVTGSQGVDCGAVCSSTVSGGTFVTLRALPSPGSTFRNWSNGTGSATVCNNSTSATCGFKASQNSAIRANFDLAQ